MKKSEVIKIIRENEKLKVDVNKWKRREAALRKEQYDKESDDLTRLNCALEVQKDRVGQLVRFLSCVHDRVIKGDGWPVKWLELDDEEWDFTTPTDDEEECFLMLKPPNGGQEMIGFLDSNGYFHCVWPSRRKLGFSEVTKCWMANGES